MSETPLYPDCDFAIWFRSVNEDNITEEPIEGQKIGTIPEWIDGCFYQNGPGVFYVGGKRVQHIFDAFSLLQKFTIKNGHVTYQNRILQSNAYREAAKHGRSRYSEYGTAGSKDGTGSSNGKYGSESKLEWIVSRVRNLLNFKNDFRTDNAMISIYPYKVYNDKIALFAMTETPAMHEIDASTIQTLSAFNISERLPIVSHCAHPIVLADGTIINVGLGPSLTGMNYIVFEFPGFSESNTGENLMNQCRTLAKIPCRWPFNPSYMHAFAITSNYIVLIEQSLSISLAKVAQLSITHGPMTDALVWNENESVRFRIINRQTMTELTEYIYLAPTFFFLHIINTYEDEGHLVLDVCCYDNSDMLICMTMEALENAQQNPDYYKQFLSRPKRYILPLSINKDAENQMGLIYSTCQAKLMNAKTLWIEPETIIAVGCELPQIDYLRFYGKFYRFFYAINTDVEYEYCGALRKIDVVSKTCEIWHEEGCYTSEPIFIRNPLSDSEHEDDGVLIMSLLRSGQENEVNFLVLDARDMTEIGRVQFKTNGPVPKNLHGLWIDSNPK